MRNGNIQRWAVVGFAALNPPYVDGLNGHMLTFGYLSEVAWPLIVPTLQRGNAATDAPASRIVFWRQLKQLKEKQLKQLKDTHFVLDLRRSFLLAEAQGVPFSSGGCAIFQPMAFLEVTHVHGTTHV